MSQNISEFINQLSSIRDKEIISVYIPSLKKSCDFLPINMKQQKELLKAVGDSAAGLVTFNKALLSIIIENSLDKSVEFSSIDRYAILIALRKACLGTFIKIDDKEYNLEDLPLSKNVSFESINFSTTVGSKNIQIEVECPLLKKDLEFLDINIFELKKDKESNLTESVVTMYTLELIKFIKSVTVNSIELPFETLSIQDKKQVVDNLPVGVIQEVFKYITSIRKIENRFITFTDSAEIQFNTLFFTVE